MNIQIAPHLSEAQHSAAGIPEPIDPALYISLPFVKTRGSCDALMKMVKSNEQCFPYCVTKYENSTKDGFYTKERGISIPLTIVRGCDAISNLHSTCFIESGGTIEPIRPSHIELVIDGATFVRIENVEELQNLFTRSNPLPLVALSNVSRIAFNFFFSIDKLDKHESLITGIRVSLKMDDIFYPKEVRTQMSDKQHRLRLPNRKMMNIYNGKAHSSEVEPYTHMTMEDYEGEDVVSQELYNDRQVRVQTFSGARSYLNQRYLDMVYSMNLKSNIRWDKDGVFVDFDSYLFDIRDGILNLNLTFQKVFSAGPLQFCSFQSHINTKSSIELPCQVEIYVGHHLIRKCSRNELPNVFTDKRPFLISLLKDRARIRCRFALEDLPTHSDGVGTDILIGLEFTNVEYCVNFIKHFETRSHQITLDNGDLLTIHPA